jgi:hypothetical protein
MTPSREAHSMSSSSFFYARPGLQRPSGSEATQLCAWGLALYPVPNIRSRPGRRPRSSLS